jgi:hypothetical protein
MAAVRYEATSAELNVTDRQTFQQLSTRQTANSVGAGLQTCAGRVDHRFRKRFLPSATEFVRKKEKSGRFLNLSRLI